jgi:hypothetical protein
MTAGVTGEMGGVSEAEASLEDPRIPFYASGAVDASWPTRGFKPRADDKPDLANLDGGTLPSTFQNRTSRA